MTIHKDLLKLHCSGFQNYFEHIFIEPLDLYCSNIHSGTIISFG